MRLLCFGGAALLAGMAVLGQGGRLGVERPAFLLGFGLAAVGYLCALCFLDRGSGDAPVSAGASFVGDRRIWIIVGSVTLFSRLLVLPVPASDDVYRYLWEGRLQSLGGNPYEVSPAEAEEFLANRPGPGSVVDPYLSRVNHPELTTIYPPVSELLFRLVTSLSYELRSWKIAVLVLDLSLVVLLAGYLRSVRRSAQDVIAYAWHPLPALSFAGEGHVDVLLLLTSWTAFFLLTKRKRALAGVAWGAAIASKFLPAIYLPILIRPLGWRGVLAGSGLLIAASLPFLGAGGGGVRTLLVFGREMSHNAPPHVELARVLGPGSAQVIVIAAFLLGSLLIVTRSSDNRHVSGAFGLTALALVLSPTVHPWYLTWLVPFFVLGRRPAWVAWSLSVGFGFLAYASEAETGRFFLSRGWRAAEYLPFYLLLLPAAARTIRRWRGAA